MNEPEKEKCQEYSQVLFGKSLKGAEFHDLVRESSSYEEFRVRSVAKIAPRSADSKQIAVRWRSSVERANDSPDANGLLHKLESLAEKQNELERKMRDANGELLAKLRALDSLATAQETWRSALDEIRCQIAEIRQSLERSEELPLRGANGAE
jgi:chromosome segregation ATPase